MLEGTVSINGHKLLEWTATNEGGTPEEALYEVIARGVDSRHVPFERVFNLIATRGSYAAVTAQIMAELHEEFMDRAKRNVSLGGNFE